MNWKTVAPLVVALGLGTVAAVVGRGVMGRRHAAPAGAGMVRVVVATEELLPGATIRAADVEVRQVPAGGFPADVVFKDAHELVGRVVTTHVVKGQAVLATLLAPKGALGGLQAMVEPGMRAVTVEVNEVSGVGGLLIPGARVDVVQTITTNGDPRGMVARAIVENVKVLAVGRRMSAEGTSGAAGEAESSLAKSVTLMASPEQAEAIDLASHVGTPRLVLRNGDDGRTGAAKGMTVAELRGDGGERGAATRPVEVVRVDVPATQPAPVVAARPAFREVEVIRAGTSTSVKVEVEAGRMDVAGGRDQLDRVVPGER
jgi:pilus assembly protein CpaB